GLLDLKLGSVALGTAVLADRAGGAIDLRLRENLEGRVVGVAGRSEASGGEDGFELASAYDCIYIGNIFLYLVAVALDEAACDDEALGFAAVGLLVLHHLEDGVDGLL